MKRKYHGWIYIEKQEGYKDYISGYALMSTGEKRYSKGDYGAAGADLAVRFFEEELGLGPIKLEPTPIGLRVFTEEKEGDDRD